MSVIGERIIRPMLARRAFRTRTTPIPSLTLGMRDAVRTECIRPLAPGMSTATDSAHQTPSGSESHCPDERHSEHRYCAAEPGPPARWRWSRAPSGA